MDEVDKYIIEPIKKQQHNRYMERTEKTVGILIKFMDETLEMRLTEDEWLILAADGSIIYEPLPEPKVGVITYKPSRAGNQDLNLKNSGLPPPEH